MASGLLGFSLAWSFEEGGFFVSLAILISTFDRYESLARWTAQRIEQCWIGHPPLFFSGLEEGDSEKDWMTLTQAAVAKLIANGFTHAYLILDDHPPMGECHSGFLNAILPSAAVASKASHISLLGFGQHRRREGGLIRVGEAWFEKSDPSYRWRFSLHPGFWNLEDLCALLDLRMREYQGSARTPWNFERHKDDPSEPIAGEIGRRCHRIRGTDWNVSFGRLPRIQEAFLRALVDLKMFAAKCTGGLEARRCVELDWFWAFGHYAGPYPIYWSGCLRQGKPHADFEKWLRVFGPVEMRDSWKQFKEISGGIFSKNRASND